ncbi:MAG: 2Fe-2S iron-sulfur cluster-binding protein [Actinomycetota bacterium]
MAEATTMTVQVRRGTDAELTAYEVDVVPGMSVFNVLEKIRNEIDPTLVFLISCRIGKCDICLLKVNGKTRWSCTETPTDGMVLEPLNRYEVMKDLAVDWERRVLVTQQAGSAGATETEE